MRVLDQLLEGVGAGHEVGLAVHSTQHANLAAHVDVARHRALGGDRLDFLAAAGQALLAQQLFGLGEVAAGLGNAFLQSIIPAPVFSRRSFTRDALTSATAFSFQ